MTTEAAAKELGVSRWAVLKAIHDKRLTSEKAGRDHFIHRDELERFKRERRPRGRPPKVSEYRQDSCRPLRAVAEQPASYDA